MTLRRIFIVAVAGLAGVVALQAQEKTALPQPSPGATAAGVDQYGDPLPAGAVARMGTLRWRHGNAVTFVGFTQGHKQVVTACQDGIFHVWDAATGKEEIGRAHV